MKGAVAQIAASGAIGDAIRPGAALGDAAGATEALDVLLGESAHFGPARVDSLEAELEGQQKRIRELETRLATAEGDAEELRQARDVLQEELAKRPLLPVEPPSPPANEPFRANMASPASDESLEENEEKLPSVSQEKALRAETAELQKMVR